MHKINSLWYSPEPPDGFFSQRLQECVDVHYQQRYRYYVYHNIPRRRVMIDVGANIGIFARPTAQQFEQVICFEPVPKIFQVLEMNLKECHNVRLYCCGISDRPQTALFSMKTMKCGQSQQVTEKSQDPEYENFECELVTLDQYGFEQVDWIKIDVEGFEDRVLEGSRDTIRRNRPWLLLEDNGNRDQHRQWLNDLCGPYEPAPVKSKTNTIWIPQ